MIRAVKGFSQRIDAFELWCESPESPLDSKEIQPAHPKGDQSWVFIGRTDVEAETPILWPPDVKSWLIWKDPDAGKDWGQEKKGTTEDEMVGWHHQLNGHGFGWTLGGGGGLGGLACCSPWGHRVGHDWVTKLNEAEVDVFLELSCFFYNLTNVDNWIIDSCASTKSSLYIWSSQFKYCWSLLWRILWISLLACEMSTSVQ